jgi:hypothetical protein
MIKLNWRSAGGLGKQIMATAVLKALREHKPDACIHAMTTYPEVFVNLDFIDRVYPLTIIPHFYEDHKDFHTVEADPYTDYYYRVEKTHFVDSWCNMLNIPLPKEKHGIIKLTEQELDFAKNIIFQWKVDRPLVAFQPFGGTSYYTPHEANNPLRPQHYRELKQETAQAVVNELVQRGYAVLHIGLPTEPVLQNCLRLSTKDPLNPRLVFALLNKCMYGIFIDSFAQHAWVALGKKNAIVLWGGTNPSNLGYSQNINLELVESCKDLHCNRPNLNMFDFNGNGQPWRCMLGGRCMHFPVDMIIDEFLKITTRK